RQWEMFTIEEADRKGRKVFPRARRWHYFTLSYDRQKVALYTEIND
ncbi:MAG: hypothetical protein ACJAZF_004974, partial [Granulosicoccus sp.]